MSVYLISIYVVYLICGAYMLLNFKSDIHMLQQNSYRISRYWRWLEQGNFMPARRLVNFAVIFLLMSTLLTPLLRLIMAAVVALVQCRPLLKAHHKKPLVFTPRVKRIYSVSAILALVPVV